MDSIPRDYRPVGFFNCPGCNEDVDVYEHVPSGERFESECACTQDGADAAGGAALFERGGHEPANAPEERDEIFEAIQQAIAELEPNLRDEIRRIQRVIAAAFAVDGERRKEPLSKRDRGLIRRASYAFRDRPEYRHVPLKMLDMMFLRATPQAWVEEERERLKRGEQ